MGLAQYAADGLFAPRRIAVKTPPHDQRGIARTAGFRQGRHPAQRPDWVRRDPPPARDGRGDQQKGQPRFGSALMAYAWYGPEPLPGFSGRQTAMQLVRSGRADDVLDYIDAVDAGVHA